MKRTIAAFLAAPLVPPLLFWALQPWLADMSDHWPTLAALPGFVLYGGVITYLATAFVGVPAHLLITTHSRLRAAHVLSIATVVGAVVVALLLSPGDDPLLIGLGAILGLSAGVTFWLIWRRNAA